MGEVESQIKNIKTYLAGKNNYIFDFDGVLVDSVEIKTEAFAHLYSGYGNEITQKVIDFHRNHGGMSRYEKFKHFHKNFLGKDVSQTEMASLDKEFSEFVVQSVINAPEIMGAEKFLQKVYSNKLCSVCSATPDGEIKVIISSRGWNDYFSYIFGSPDSKKDNIDKVLNESGMTKKESVFFGDARADYEAAKSCGIDFIGVGDLWNDIDTYQDILAVVPSLQVLV